MNMLPWDSIFKLILGLLGFVSKMLNDRQQRKIGEDKQAKKTLTEIAERSAIAKRIETHSGDLTVDDVDRILQRHYRKEGGNNQ
jgi:hypothetical protein